MQLKRDWDSLAFLENLLASGGEGLQYTTNISVSLEEDDLEVTDRSKEFGPDTCELDDVIKYNRYRQRGDQPRALNALMRLIIYRVPKNRLQGFKYVLHLYWGETITSVTSIDNRFLDGTIRHLARS